jgi:redox-sensitive bicupin YhaK (pirin superfamily)
MIILRKASERGHADHGWLNSYHSFSFADYYDPQHMGFAALRVINEDYVQPGKGFGTHSHRDMEIITYILEGALEHKDSMGNGSVIRPGDVQRMSAGRGVQHSEFNASPHELVHLLQIWIEPNVNGIEPSYEEKHFDAASKRGTLRLVASRDAREGSVTIHQDASVYAALIDGAEHVSHPLAMNRNAYVHIARGKVTVNGQSLVAGDAVKASGETDIVLERGDEAEILVFDLP